MSRVAWGLAAEASDLTFRRERATPPGDRSLQQREVPQPHPYSRGIQPRHRPNSAEEGKPSGLVPEPRDTFLPPRVWARHVKAGYTLIEQFTPPGKACQIVDCG